MRNVISAATPVLIIICACSDRLTAPEAVELVTKVEASIRPGGNPGAWLGTIAQTDLRLGAPLSTISLRRDGQSLGYRAIVFERVVRPSARAGDAVCAGTHRGAYFWGREKENDGVLFFPAGRFDDRFVPALRSCSPANQDTTAVITALGFPSEGWMQELVAGDISPGVATGSCAFLEPAAERVLREQHGVTCELTRHYVQFAARLRAAAGTDTVRIELDTTAIIGVRYTIDCDAASSSSSVPCAGKPATP